jgi:ketosteroid isomerase-like protein
MKNDTDLKAIAKKFFAAYDVHDVEGMLALCADDAQGRYVPYGRDSVVPIRGGIDGIWRAFPQAVPDFRVEVVEMLAERNTVIIQTERADTGGSSRHRQEGAGRLHPSRLFSAFQHAGQDFAPRRLLGQHRSEQHQTKRRVSGGFHE